MTVRQTLPMLAALLVAAFGMAAPAHADGYGYSFYGSRGGYYAGYSGGHSSGGYGYGGGRSYSGGYGSGGYGGYYRPSSSHSRSYSGGKSSYYRTPSYNRTPTQQVRTTSYSSGEKRYYYRARSSTGDYNFRTAGARWDSRTGYTGANTSISRPHRSDWEAYLERLQRQSDNSVSYDDITLCGNYLRAPAACRNTTTRYDPVRYVEVRYIPEVSGAYR